MYPPDHCHIESSTDKALDKGKKCVCGMMDSNCLCIVKRDSCVPNSNMRLKTLKTGCYFYLFYLFSPDSDFEIRNLMLLACVFTCEQYEGGQAGKGRGVQV